MKKLRQVLASSVIDKDFYELYVREKDTLKEIILDNNTPELYTDLEDFTKEHLDYFSYKAPLSKAIFNASIVFTYHMKELHPKKLIPYKYKRKVKKVDISKEQELLLNDMLLIAASYENHGFIAWRTIKTKYINDYQFNTITDDIVKYWASKNVSKIRRKMFKNIDISKDYIIILITSYYKHTIENYGNHILAYVDAELGLPVFGLIEDIYQNRLNDYIYTRTLALWKNIKNNIYALEY